MGIVWTVELLGSEYSRYRGYYLSVIGTRWYVRFERHEPARYGGTSVDRASARADAIAWADENPLSVGKRIAAMTVTDLDALLRERDVARMKFLSPHITDPFAGHVIYQIGPNSRVVPSLEALVEELLK